MEADSPGPASDLNASVDSEDVLPEIGQAPEDM